MRIVSLLPAATDWVVTLGAVEELVGCSHECTVPDRTVMMCTRPVFDSAGDSAEIDRAVRDALREGLSLYEVDLEALREVRSDVILTQAQCEVWAVTLPQLEAFLEHTLDPVPRLVSLEPMTLKQILDDGLRIGRAIGRLQEAMAFIAEQENRLQQLQEQLTGASKRTGGSSLTVVCIEWLEPIMTAGHWMPDVVEQAGGVPLLAQKGQPSQAVEWSHVRSTDPDVLLLMPCGFTLSQTVRDLHYLTHKDGWEELKAVREERVYLVDGSVYFNRSGPSIYRGIHLLASCLHERLELPGISYEQWEIIHLRDVAAR